MPPGCASNRLLKANARLRKSAPHSTDMAVRIEAETGSAMQHIGDRTAKMTITADEMRGLAERVSVSAQGAAGAAASALDNAQAVAGAAEEPAASIRDQRAGRTVDRDGGSCGSRRKTRPRRH